MLKIRNILVDINHENIFKGDKYMEISRVNNTIDMGVHTDNPSMDKNIKVGSQNVENTLAQEARKYTEDEIIETIEKANEEFIAYDRRFEFSIHEKTKKIMVKIIDVANDEIIREIPPEKILDLVAAIWEMVGILVDERA